MRANDANAYIYKYAVAWCLGLNREKHKMFKHILRNLEKIAEAEEFMNLNVNQICEILIGAYQDWIVTGIDNYYNLFMMGLKWIDHDQAGRLCYAIPIMSCVPFKKMTKKEILLCYYPPVAKYVVMLPGVKSMIQSAIYTNVEAST
ncbi:BTB domain-containing protein [Nephila pilipes]|uniref:BTB domain-containing protein n=1 Tax=Nephila pilipes TaxID=299642 RepID=A0A8X6IT71_NEPPI|nr:BTB domain-containing protein [Nephila pilipes]